MISIWDILAASLGLTGLFGMGMWVGYRFGYSNGLATWRKDYKSMTPRDVAAHKRIISTWPGK